MAITNFTPAPWTIKKDCDGGYDFVEIIGRNDLQVAQLESAAGYEQATKADAHLLASAPDLYAALDAFLDAYEETGAVDFAVRQKARAALNRAEGRTP